MALGKQPSRLGKAPSRMAQAGKTETQARYEAKPWRAWYALAIWEQTRRAAFLRDGYLCRMCGRVCDGTGRQPSAPIGDHITPHQGDWASFIDPSNIQTLCKACHDSTKQRQERAAPYARG